MSYKILSLDGGRSWALIQARILQDIYGDIKGHELLKHFDVVIANSGQCFWLFKCQVKFRLAEILFINQVKENLKNSPAIKNKTYDVSSNKN